MIRTSDKWGQCHNCKRWVWVQGHHIVGGNGKRKSCETDLSVVDLCWECHYGNNGCHGKNGRKLVVGLRKELQQKYFDRGYTESEVRELMGGKLY